MLRAFRLRRLQTYGLPLLLPLKDRELPPCLLVVVATHISLLAVRLHVTRKIFIAQGLFLDKFFG